MCEGMGKSATERTRALPEALQRGLDIQASSFVIRASSLFSAVSMSASRARE